MVQAFFECNVEIMEASVCAGARFFRPLRIGG